VSLLCDGGERYQHTYYDDQWLEEKGFDLTSYCNQLEAFHHHGEFPVVL
jgi:cysteine synthase